MDTAGQEKFRVQANAYLRGAFGVLLVYDICDKPSFEHLEDWLTLIRDNGSSDMIIMVLGNKSDKKHERLVNIKEAEQFCETNKLRADIGGETQLMHREVSAYDGEGVEEAFNMLVDAVYEKRFRPQILLDRIQNEIRSEETHKDEIILQEEEPAVEEGKACCVIV